MLNVSQLVKFWINKLNVGQLIIYNCDLGQVPVKLHRKKESYLNMKPVCFYVNKQCFLPLHTLKMNFLSSDLEQSGKSENVSVCCVSR